MSGHRSRVFLKMGIRSYGGILQDSCTHGPDPLNEGVDWCTVKLVLDKGLSYSLNLEISVLHRVFS